MPTYLACAVEEAGGGRSSTTENFVRIQRLNIFTSWWAFLPCKAQHTHVSSPSSNSVFRYEQNILPRVSPFSFFTITESRFLFRVHLQWLCFSCFVEKKQHLFIYSFCCCQSQNVNFFFHLLWHCTVYVLFLKRVAYSVNRSFRDKRSKTWRTMQVSSSDNG